MSLTVRAPLLSAARNGSASALSAIRPLASQGASRRVACDAYKLKFAGDGTSDHLAVPDVPGPTEFELPVPSKLTVGRSEGNDIHIPVSTVSGQHCIILAEDGMVRIGDVGSTNGTFVNDIAIKPMEDVGIQPGSYITFADSHLARYQLIEYESEEAAPAADEEGSAADARAWIEAWRAKQ
ncbi:unnamed protein product [Pedinophyceae sp. YPF-701]|nr:unnamed protein product [Pedinophyceae sp. YPF-701]